MHCHLIVVSCYAWIFVLCVNCLIMRWDTLLLNYACHSRYKSVVLPTIHFFNVRPCRLLTDVNEQSQLHCYENLDHRVRIVS